MRLGLLSAASKEAIVYPFFSVTSRSSLCLPFLQETNRKTQRRVYLFSPLPFPSPPLLLIFHKRYLPLKMETKQMWLVVLENARKILFAGFDFFTADCVFTAAVVAVAVVVLFFKLFIFP